MKLGKNKRGLRRGFVFLCIGLTACSTLTTQRSAEGTVKRFVDAFNQHDTEAMLIETTADVQWYSINGEIIQTESSGQQQLRQAMTNYFASLPSAHSSLTSINSQGDFVSTIEKAMWQQQGKSQQQCAVAVYQLFQNKISKVWYYPATACEYGHEN